MRIRRFIAGIGLYAMLGMSPAEANPSVVGLVQVKTTSGTKVALADLPHRTSEGPEGVTFRNVASGMHRVVGHREGYRPQFGWVEVLPSEVTVFEFGSWQPAPTKLVTDSGSLVVRTFPVDATISAKKLGWEKIEKAHAPFVASAVAPGRYKFTFCNAYKCIDHRANITAHRVTSLFVDFEHGRVENRTRSERARLLRSIRNCIEHRDVHACRWACRLETALGKGSRSCQVISAPSSPDNRTVVEAMSDRNLP